MPLEGFTLVYIATMRHAHLSRFTDQRSLDGSVGMQGCSLCGRNTERVEYGIGVLAQSRHRV